MLRKSPFYEEMGISSSLTSKFYQNIRNNLLIPCCNLPSDLIKLVNMMAKSPQIGLYQTIKPYSCLSTLSVLHLYSLCPYFSSSQGSLNIVTFDFRCPFTTFQDATVISFLTNIKQSSRKYVSEWLKIGQSMSWFDSEMKVCQVFTGWLGGDSNTYFTRVIYPLEL